MSSTCRPSGLITSGTSTEAALDAQRRNTGHDWEGADAEAVGEIGAAAIVLVANAQRVGSRLTAGKAEQAVRALGQQLAAGIGQCKDRLELRTDWSGHGLDRDLVAGLDVEAKEVGIAGTE